MDGSNSKEIQAAELVVQPPPEQATVGMGTGSVTGDYLEKRSDNNEPWDVLSKVLSVLSVCHINKILNFDGHGVSYARTDTFARTMQSKNVDVRKKAKLMVAQVLQTAASGSTDAGWDALGVIVEDIVRGREGFLEDDEWISLAAVFYAKVSGASSWARDLLVLSRLQRAMGTLDKPLQQLKGRKVYQDLACDIAVSFCKAGLFLAVVGQSGRIAAIAASKGNRASMTEYEEELHKHLQTLAAKGLVNSADHFWHSVEMFPFNVPFTQHPEFCGRREVMEELQGQFHGTFRRRAAQANGGAANGTSSQVTAVCLWGSEGVGKTELALEFVYRHVAEYRGCFWVNAAELCYQDSFLALARHLQVEVNPQESLSEQVEKIRGVLEDGRKVLLVLDNVESEATLARLLPHAGSAHVLITARTKVKATADIRLDAMSHSEGLQLLKGVQEYFELKGGVLVECVEALQCYPLGLGVASHAFSTSMDAPTLLRLLKKDLPKKAAQSTWDGTFRKPSSLKNLLESSLNKLTTPEGSLAVSMLETITFFAVESIPVPLLLTAAQRLRALLNQEPVGPQYCQLAVDVLVSHRLATVDHVRGGLAFNSVLCAYAQFRQPGPHARAAVLSALAQARCCDTMAAHFAATWQSRKELMGKAEEALQVSTVGSRLAEHWAQSGRAREAVALWDELLERKRFPLPVPMRARAHLSTGAVLLENLGDALSWEKEISSCARELPKGELETAHGLALQVEQLWGRVLTPRGEASGRKGGPSATLAESSAVAALQSLAFRLCKNVKDRDERGPLGALVAVSEDDALLAVAMTRLTRLLSEHKLAPLGDCLGLTRRSLEVRERVLNGADRLLTASLHSLGQMYGEMRELSENQQLLLEAFSVAAGGAPSWGSAPPSLVGLHLSHEQRKEACSVYEVYLAQAEVAGRTHPLEEAHALASLGLAMQGPLTADILEKARYALEGAIADVGGSCGAPLPSPQGQLMSTCKATLGEIQFRLGEPGHGLAGAQRWIQDSVLAGSACATDPSSLVQLARAVAQGKADGHPGLGKDILVHRLVLLARIFIQVGELGAAKDHLEAGAAVLTAGEQQQPVQLGRVYALLAAVEWLQRGVGEKTLGLLAQAKTVIGKELGGADLELADIWDCIGRVHELRGDAGEEKSWDSAFKTYSQSLAIREKNLGGKHPALAFNLVSLARIELRRGQEERAKKCEMKAAELLEGRTEADLVELQDVLSSLHQVS